MATPREDPYGAFNYLVEISGIRAGGFSEISGLDLEVQTIDYRNGDEDFIHRKLPGIKRISNITLKRGIIGELDVFRWVLAGARGVVSRRDAAIVLRDELRREVMRWKLTRAWACKYMGPAMQGDSNAVAVEAIEIAHEGLEVL